MPSDATEGPFVFDHPNSNGVVSALASQPPLPGQRRTGMVMGFVTRMPAVKARLKCKA